MFRAFNVKDTYFNDDYQEEGRLLYEKHERAVRQSLDSFLSPNGSIDGARLKEDWFPQVKADVFISHSHKDEERAIRFAGWLKHHFNLTAFIDASIWGYAGDLLKMIDNTYCKNEVNNTYDYEARNYSTAHVHMMLSTALQMMIDNTECLFFLNTPSSISSANAVQTKTASTWIYAEVVMAQLIRRRPKEEHRTERKKTFSKARNLNEGRLRIEHTIDLSGLTDLDADDLNEWERKFNQSSLHRKPHPLDELYRTHSDELMT